MRDMIFLSHSNPEDNEFTLWLALQLAREGYPVWCDLTKLLGGEDAWKDIGVALSNRIVKFVYVLSKISNEKDGPLQELTLAKKVAKKNMLHDFVIPALIDDLSTLDFNPEITRINAIPFRDGWPLGLKILLDKLHKDGVQRDTARFCPASVRDWWKTRISADLGVINREEEYFSNWFEIELPERIYFHKIKTSSIGDTEIEKKMEYPVIRHNQFFITFAESKDLLVDGRGFTEGGRSFCLSTQRFIKGLDLPEFLSKTDTNNIVLFLYRKIWEKFTERKGLLIYEMANKVKAFYGTESIFGKKRIVFDGLKGKEMRSLVGYKTMKTSDGNEWKRYWHFAISTKPILWPRLAYVVRSHVIFSRDGTNAMANSEIMHRARRSQCKDWWNDDWRDRILCFMDWLRGTDESINIKVSSRACIKVSARPISLTSPVSYREPVGRSKMSILDQYEEEGVYEEEANKFDEGTLCT